MTITPAYCPECGAAIKGTVDVVPGTARLVLVAVQVQPRMEFVVPDFTESSN